MRPTSNKKVVIENDVKMIGLALDCHCEICANAPQTTAKAEDCKLFPPNIELPSGSRPQQQCSAGKIGKNVCNHHVRGKPRMGKEDDVLGKGLSTNCSDDST